MDFELTAEQRMLRDQVARFVDQEVIPRAPMIDEEERFPEENFRALAEMGLFGITLPPDYGGAGADFLSGVLVMEQLMRGCVSTGNTFGAHTVLCAESLFRNGNEEQRRRFLPDLLSGKKIGALALTEPGAGSDALSLRCRAEKKGDRYRLNGSKTFITNGPIADVVIVYAKTNPEAGPQGISAFIVEDGFSGFTKGRPMKKMGVRGSPTGELFFEDCEVPEENLLGAENRGIEVLMSGLDRERIFWSIAPIGVAQGAFDLAFRYARERIQFGQPIVQFQMIQDILADIATEIQAGRVLAYWAATLAGSGKKVRLEASYAKLFCAEVGVRAVGRAMQVFGGYGFIREYPIERMYRDVKGIEFGAGTNQIQKLIILGELLKKKS
ncbi:MAG: acyl-CoA dehydrogenase family protein [Deltaproteobacteria bacterium]|nr:acyl-CoA dehydrogenase family protein [Deltaproteobacteria bacterium]